MTIAKPTKLYKKKIDTIEAYQVNPSGCRETLQVNQSGFFDVAYHGETTTSAIGWVKPGDYVVHWPNGIWSAMSKADFEAIYEPVEKVPVIESVKEVIPEVAKVEEKKAEVTETPAQPAAAEQSATASGKSVYEGKSFNATDTLKENRKPYNKKSYKE